MCPSWIDTVERRLAHWRQRRLGRAWVVGVSGGGDSVGLLLVLHQLQSALELKLSVAHLNHGVRAEAGDADATFVSELARSLDLPLDVGTWRPIRAGHFEADARRARYEWLVRVARARGASVVAVGHTRDDQAETILHRMIRGTGLRGLAGMPATRRLDAGPQAITLVRPLLPVNRSEIRRFLVERGQAYREDETNQNLARTRARLRHDLLPRLSREYNRDITGAIVRLGALAAAAQRVVDADLRALEQRAISTREADSVVLSQSVLQPVSSFLRAEILRRVWRQLGWSEAAMSARRWRRLAALIDEREITRAEIGSQVEATVMGGYLVLHRQPSAGSPVLESPGAEPILLGVPGLTAVPWAGGAIDARIDPRVVAQGHETIDLDRVSLPLVVRAPAVGDRFHPLGLAGKSQALADFFRGRHVPRGERRRTPVVCDQIGILWVVGHRIADRVKLTEASRRTLELAWVAELPPTSATR